MRWHWVTFGTGCMGALCLGVYWLRTKSPWIWGIQNMHAEYRKRVNTIWIFLWQLSAKLLQLLAWTAFWNCSWKGFKNVVKRVLVTVYGVTSFMPSLTSVHARAQEYWVSCCTKPRCRFCTYCRTYGGDGRSARTGQQITSLHAINHINLWKGCYNEVPELHISGRETLASKVQCILDYSCHHLTRHEWFWYRFMQSMLGGIFKLSFLWVLHVSKLVYGPHHARHNVTCHPVHSCKQYSRRFPARLSCCNSRSGEVATSSRDQVNSHKAFLLIPH